MDELPRSYRAFTGIPCLALASPVTVRSVSQLSSQPSHPHGVQDNVSLFLFYKQHKSVPFEEILNKNSLEMCTETSEL